jgi:hypothetical protein
MAERAPWARSSGNHLYQRGKRIEDTVSAQKR